MRQILLNCESILAPFMESRCGVAGAFSKMNGRAIAMLNVNDEEGFTEVLAGIWYEGFNGRNVNMHCAGVPDRRWMNKTLLWMAFNYPFVQLGAVRVTGLVDESNTVARQFNERIGFTLEARLKNAARGGDLLIYVMHREDCRWLGLRERKISPKELH